MAQPQRSWRQLAASAIIGGTQWAWNNPDTVRSVWNTGKRIDRGIRNIYKMRRMARNVNRFRLRALKHFSRRSSYKARSYGRTRRRSGRTVPRRSTALIRKRGRPICSSTRSSVPRPVGRFWPPEVLRQQLSTMSIFDMIQEGSTSMCGSVIVLGTRLDSGDITHWSSNNYLALSRTAALPRNWTQFSPQYEKYRIMRVRHFVKISKAPSTTEKDSIICVVSTSESHQDQPFTHPTPRTTLPAAAPWNNLDEFSRKIENYRHTKKYRLISNSSTQKDVNFVAQPYIFRDHVGQKIIGGKQKDTTGSGPGTAVANPIGDTDLPVGLCGRVYVYMFPYDHKRVATNVSFQVRVRTVFDIEFFDRKESTHIQTGGNY